MKIGIIKEGKNPPDKRVPLSPQQCKYISQKYLSVSLYVQSSEIRCFSDSEYIKNGIEIVSDLSFCDIILGVKEVPVEMLIDNKVFFFFSHTIKKQPYNQDLLKQIIAKNIQLIDYETLVYNNLKRVIGFGRYAGIVGAYNTFLTHGLKTKKYTLPYAHTLDSKTQLDSQLLNVKLPSNFKILLTGDGRVSQGVQEILEILNIKKVSKNNFINMDFNCPVYTQLLPSDYYIKKGQITFDKSDFYKYPDKYESCLNDFTIHSNMLITGHYHAPNNPFLLSKKELEQNKKLKVIGDISCDISGPIASTIRPSTISQPVYGYNCITGLEDNIYNNDVIAVMAVDNLPCSLPKDASIDFGSVFVEKVLPDLLSNGEIISRGTIVKDGNLSERFNYLSDYIV